MKLEDTVIRVALLMTLLHEVDCSSTTVTNNDCEPCACTVARMNEINEEQAVIANCSGVGISQIPQNLPTNLAVLDISYNQDLQMLNQSDFERYEQMKYLAIKGHEAQSIEGSAFLKSKQLKFLDVIDSTFIDLPVEIFSDLENLRTIDGLHVNKIKEGTFDGLQTLRTIHLTVDNDTVPGTLFKNLTLMRVTLIVPNCVTLPANIFTAMSNASLVYLKIVANKLIAFPEDLLKGFSELNEVYLEADAVAKLPPHMLHGDHTTTATNELEPSNETSVEEKQADLGAAVKLTGLTLVGINEIGDHELQLLKNIRKLVIQRAAKIHGNAFQDLQGLQTLEVSHSNLSSFNLDLVSHNRSGASDRVGISPLLKTLNLSSNPFDCTCNLIKTLSIVDSNHTKIIGTCVEPLNLNGTRLKDLKATATCPVTPSMPESTNVTALDVLPTTRRETIVVTALKLFPAKPVTRDTTSRGGKPVNLLGGSAITATPFRTETMPTESDTPNSNGNAITTNSDGNFEINPTEDYDWNEWLGTTSGRSCGHRKLGKNDGKHDEYVWLKITGAVLACVTFICASAMFLIKMRGILYKHDYNCDKTWHV